MNTETKVQTMEDENIFWIISQRFLFATGIIVLHVIAKVEGWLSDGWLYYSAKMSTIGNSGFESSVLRTAVKIFTSILFWLASVRVGSMILVGLLAIVISGVSYLFYKAKKLPKVVGGIVIGFMTLIFIFLVLSPASRDDQEVMQEVNSTDVMF